MDNRILVDNIKKYAKEKNMSISQIERQLHWSPGLISRWRSIGMSPSIQKIMDLSSLLGVPVCKLLDAGQAETPRSAAPSGGLALITEMTADMKLQWLVMDEAAPFGTGVREFIEEQPFKRQDCRYCAHESGYFLLLAQSEGTDSAVPMDLKLLASAGKNHKPFAVPSDLDGLVLLLSAADYDLYTLWSRKHSELFYKNTVGEATVSDAAQLIFLTNVK